MKIVDCCNNLNSFSSTSLEAITEDTGSNITVTTTSTLLLPANVNRRIVKLYVVDFSQKATELWIKYGSSASLLNTAHPLLFKHLLIIDTAQAAKAISAICTVGTATLRVSSAEKI